MARFFVTDLTPSAETYTLTGENAAHAQVLRLRPGEEVTLCDGQGLDYPAWIREAGKKTLELEVGRPVPSASEARVRVRVLMAYAKSDKLEHVIQKAVELGAAEIAAFPTARCVSRPDSKSLEKKLERWQKIALSAAEQSRRALVPRVTALETYEQALQAASEADRAIFLYENEHSHTLRQSLESSAWTSVALMTGPEGGFTDGEAEQARAAGLEICTLGPRILRCETAPLCAMSAVMYAAGEY